MELIWIKNWRVQAPKIKVIDAVSKNWSCQKKTRGEIRRIQSNF